MTPQSWHSMRITEFRRIRHLLASPPLTPGKCTLPLPYVIALKTRGPRILLPVPIYHGMRFQLTVRRRSMPASRFSWKKFLAVSSGLFRKMKPDFTALGPGASSRNKHSASTPPSMGSKHGILYPRPFRSRRSATTHSSSALMSRCPSAPGPTRNTSETRSARERRQILRRADAACSRRLLLLTFESVGRRPRGR